VGRARATASGRNAATHRTRTGRVCGQRLRTAGVGAGGRRRGEPLVARACRTLSLPGVPRAVRRELALLGTEWPPRTRLSVVDFTRLEDKAARRLDRLE